MSAAGPGKLDEDESAETSPDSGDHRTNAETVKRGYSFDMGRRDDGGENPVRSSDPSKRALHAHYKPLGIN